ncbi:SDR family NAD(P)-dependent oxidoreductase [Sphingomonas astaxanthinifaciens]|uniref:3-hydroxyacyl-CoA dehydrogenase n=1 Tax=Sphingomonas astaxanthinifaciens DSM 22298 TaxID=1123267 RepID=A0ABQ5Z2W0_9SPHN|nr:SDR family oxidoreductase [Sphingomonas astaxanthinifaciens]GLR47114.1 3-hydroxyacyl-CoA dehydrogenase [Sphingomonas astaxanthinifaciens DSM 22298]
MTWATGKHALITGGGTGIGAAVARALAAAGATVSLIGRRADLIEAVARETGGSAFVADVTDPEQQSRAFTAARAAHGAFDYVVLNAGIGDSRPFLRTKRETWDAILATNLTALFDGAQLALPDLQAPGKRLVIVASVAGLKGGAMAAPYVASKHGAVGLARSLALEFARTGLTVNAICPSFVDTPMVDASAERIAGATGRSVEEARAMLAKTNGNGRLITADEVAYSVVQLLHPDASGVNGACVTIDGGTSA